MQTAIEQANDAATVGIRVRPPILFLGALLLGFALDHLLRVPVVIPREGELAHRIIPAIPILIGIAVFSAGIRDFFNSSTPVPCSQPVRTLVTTGIHIWSRNPIYVGMFLVYIGIGIAVRSPWIIILTVPIVVILRFAVIAREEAYLEDRFGDPYRDYKARVRRWL